MLVTSKPPLYFFKWFRGSNRGNMPPQMSTDKVNGFSSNTVAWCNTSLLWSTMGGISVYCPLNWSPLIEQLLPKCIHTDCTHPRHHLIGFYSLISTNIQWSNNYTRQGLITNKCMSCWSNLDLQQPIEFWLLTVRLTIECYWLVKLLWCMGEFWIIDVLILG